MIHIVMIDGEARLADHRHLKAEYVARMHVDGGESIDEVMQHYGLTRAEVYAALAYYHENQEVLDADYERFWAENPDIDSTPLTDKIKARLRQQD